MRYGFGVDIYGPHTKIGCFDENGNLVEKWTIVTPMQQGGNQILPRVAEEIETYLSNHRIFEDDVIGIGVGIPGPVNNSGTVNKCVNFGWGIFNINSMLAGLTGLPVVSGNIATLSALGECWKGSGTPNMVFMALNTGLGGGVVCNGSVVNGALGGAGEFGHMVVNKAETETCTCGRRGCVEQYCSPTGILKMARRSLSSHIRPSAMRKMSMNDYRDVFRAAEGGDKIANDVVNQVCDYAGQALANICCVTNPDTVVLGGQFGSLGTAVAENIARCFHKYVFHANESVRFEFAKLGTDACIYGAFKLVLDHCSE